MLNKTDLEKVVWDSDLDPAPRLIMLALLRKSDFEDAYVPPEFAPSLTVLQRMTGYSRGVIAEWLNGLEDYGWLKREAPPANTRERNGYRLFEGMPGVKRRERKRAAKSEATGTPGVPVADGGDVDADPSALIGTPSGPVRVADQSTGTPSGPELVRVADHTGTPGVLAPYVPSTTPKTSSSSAAPTKSTEGKSTAAKKPKREPKPEPYRDDVEAVCAHFVERVVANGSKRPKVTDAWRKAARLLLDDTDRPEPLTVKKINNLITWCQDHHHWRSRVQAMPKFRECYDAIRLQALSEWERQNRAGGGRRQPHQNPDDQSVYDGEL